jgi:hypothetical protein
VSQAVSQRMVFPKGMTAMFSEYATAPAGSVHAALEAIGMVRA